MITIADINGLTAPQWVSRFGFLFEHSPWVVEVAGRARPFADFAAMERAMNGALRAEGEGAVLAVLRAHPELGGRALLEKALTTSSTAEQKAAGLDRLSQEEIVTFTALNTAYRARFGFPFIICVGMTDKNGIVRAMAERLNNRREDEIENALEEIGKIVHLRLRDSCA